jgi:sugar lactone lactonase YvrE
MNRTVSRLNFSLILTTFASLGLGVTNANAALLVGNTTGNSVSLFNDKTGQFLKDFIPSDPTKNGGLIAPDGLTFGSDGNLYVSSGDTSSNSAILRYDGKTGKFLDTFAIGGGLQRPYGSAFGPDGDLYVSSFLTDQILRYDGQTGAFKGVFATGNGLSGGLNGPNGLLFVGNDLYVSTEGSVAGEFPGLPSQVLKYDLATGDSTVFVDQPDPQESPFGFISFLGLALGPDDKLFVSDFANSIRSYDLKTGDRIATLPTVYTNPASNFLGNLTITPDNRLFTVGFDFNQNNIGTILRYDAVTGAPLPSSGNSGAVFVAASDRLQRPIGIKYIEVPEPTTVASLLLIGTVGAIANRRRQA